MNGNCLVDANILVYAHDRSSPAKQVRALEVLDQLEFHQKGVLSTQVLGEFFWVATRKLARPLTAKEGYEALEDLLRSWKTVEVTRQIVLEAAGACARHLMQFWDAQIWATAKLNQITIILSEDFSHGSRIDGVEFVNPFIAAFPGEE
ncbi:MAG TPA: PIN domain-containing protein [Terriglobia bacterium]|nr:PIN domain-containing protein [Terriglobia bacterium]